MSSQIRVRSSTGAMPSTYPFTAEEYPGVTLYRENWKSFRSYSVITDIVGTPKTQRVKPCSHVQLNYRGSPLHDFHANHDLWIWFNGNPPLPYIDAAYLLEQTGFFLPHTETVKAANEAIIAFAERFPTKISGAEFIQGIMELSALIPKITASLQRFASGVYLTKKFGWDNLLSDVSGFLSLVRSIRERMEFLKRTYGKPVKLHFKKVLPVPFTGPYPGGGVAGTEWSIEQGDYTGWRTRLTLDSCRCEFRASATLVQETKHIDDFIGWLRAIVISLGFNNIAGSVWKTSRLSFVVDWFLNVSGHLARLAAVQPADRWDVYDVSSSTTLTAFFSCYQVSERTDGAPKVETYLGPLVLKRYERAIGLPLDLTVFTPSSATPDQLVLIAAMIGAK